MNPTDLLTVREIAHELGVRVHRVKYALEEFAIQPRQRAGVIRLWAREDLPRFKSALDCIAGRREVAGA